MQEVIVLLVLEVQTVVLPHGLVEIKPEDWLEPQSSLRTVLVEQAARDQVGGTELDNPKRARVNRL